MDDGRKNVQATESAVVLAKRDVEAAKARLAEEAERLETLLKQLQESPESSVTG